MTKWRVTGIVIVAALVGSVLMQQGPATAQIKKGKTRTAETKYLMRGIVKAHCGGLGGLLKGDGPKTDEQWDTAACHASCLNELSHSLMADGRCPDKTWKEACDTLRGCSEVVLKAVKDKDAKKASSAFSALTKSCGACHKAHKK